MSVLQFPLWVVINTKVHAEKGWPYSLITVGPGPRPTALAVFTTKEIGEGVWTIRSGGLPHPWEFTPLNCDAFYDVLKSATQQGMVTHVTIDFGTEHAQIYNVEEFLDLLKPESRN
jgi:hypothetical protein